MPGVREAVLSKITVVVLPGVNGLVPNVTVVPAGFPLAVKSIGVEKPPVEVVAKLAVALEVEPQAMFAPADGENVNPIAGGVIAKLALLISKKIFPTASTLIRAVVVTLFGTVIVSVPSFGVLSTITTGHV